MTTPPAADAASAYAAMSPTTLFNAMAEAANRLTGQLVHAADTASTDEQRQHLLARMQRVRDERWAVRVDDRDTQLARIQQWEQERRSLQADTE
jgi:hypothetical protein